MRTFIIALSAVMLASSCSYALEVSAGAAGQNSGVKTDLNKIENRLKALIAVVEAMGNDVDGLLTDVSTLQTDVSDLESEVTDLRRDVGNVPNSVADLYTQIQGLDSRITNNTNKVNPLDNCAANGEIYNKSTRTCEAAGGSGSCPDDQLFMPDHANANSNGCVIGTIQNKSVTLNVSGNYTLRSKGTTGYQYVPELRKALDAGSTSAVVYFHAQNRTNTTSYSCSSINRTVTINPQASSSATLIGKSSSKDNGISMSYNGGGSWRVQVSSYKNKFNSGARLCRVVYTRPQLVFIRP